MEGHLCVFNTQGIADQKGIPYPNVHLQRLEINETFPKRIKMGQGSYGRIGWLEEEIDTWIAERVTLKVGHTL